MTRFSPARFRPSRKLSRFVTGLIMSACLGACATTVTDYPTISKAQIDADTADIQRGVIDAYLGRINRVNDIAWPLLTTNADLCFERTSQGFGMTLGNAETVRGLVDGLTLEQVRAAGYDDHPVVLGVSLGSPAALAGVKPGARPIRVGDEDLNGSMEKLVSTINLYKALQIRAASDDTLESVHKPLRVTFEQDGERLETELELVSYCNIPIGVAETNSVNASASGARVRINRGLLNYFADDDDAVGVIMAHEIGHVIGRHVPKRQRNAMVTGYALWGVPVAIGATLMDTLVASPLERWAGVETPPGAAGLSRLNNSVLGIRSFEQEADYVGLYLAARAGVDISAAEDVFVGFGKISPRSTYGQRSHPVTPERVLSVRATRDEIEAKQAAGELLIPNSWPYPVALTQNEAGEDANP